MKILFHSLSAGSGHFLPVAVESIVAPDLALQLFKGTLLTGRV